MRFSVITLFPELINDYASESILGRAIKNKKIEVKAFNPRDFVSGKYKKVWPDGNMSKQVDERPFGGGPGMVVMAEPVLKAVEKAIGKNTAAKKVKYIFFSPSGMLFSNDYAKKLVKQKYTDIILISGRYEGIDARVQKILKAEAVSVGDYVLTGGEVPAMAVIDCVSRQIPGVLGNFDSREEVRVSSSEIYTRPEIIEWKGKKYKVPKVLLSGDHKKIEEWKMKKGSH